MNGRRTARDRLRHSLFLLALVALIGLVLLALRFAFDTQHQFLADVGSISAYVTAVGTLYGILAAFTIVVVWGQFNDTELAITSETTDLVDLYRYVTYLGEPPATSRFRTAITTYAEAVATEEWSAMATGRKSERAQAAFETIFHAVNSVRVDHVRDEAAWHQIISKLEDLSGNRDKRLEVASTRIPWVLRELFYGVSFALVLGFFMLSFRSDFLAICTTLFTTALAVFVIDTVLDIDNPFDGDWSIDSNRFSAIKDKLAEIDQCIEAPVSWGLDRVAS